MKKMVLFAAAVAALFASPAVAAENEIDLVLKSVTPVTATSNIDKLTIDAESGTFDVVAGGNLGSISDTTLKGAVPTGTDNKITATLTQLEKVTATGEYGTAKIGGEKVAAVQQAVGNSMSIDDLTVSDTGNGGINSLDVVETQSAAVASNYSATTVNLTGEQASNVVQAMGNSFSGDTAEMTDVGAAGTNVLTAKLTQNAPVTAKMVVTNYNQTGLKTATSIIAAGNSFSLKKATLTTK